MGGRENNSEIAELQRRIAVYEDAISYKELFARLFHPLKRFAVGFVKTPETAEEIVSDVFMEIWKRRAGLLAIADLKVYMYICVKNESLRRFHLSHRLPTFPLDNFTHQFTSSYIRPDEAMLNSELLHRINFAINQLPPRCRLVFKLAKEDKLKYKEIAEILQISIKTVDNQLAHALQKIAAAINFRLKKNSAL